MMRRCLPSARSESKQRGRDFALRKIRACASFRRRDGRIKAKLAAPASQTSIFHRGAPPEEPPMTHDSDRDAAFSRPLAAAEVPEEGLTLHIVARPDECAALAAQDGLVAVDRLEADLAVRRKGAGGVAVTGELRAALRQTCVVTLEEFDATIVEPIEIAFAPEPAPRPPEPAHRRTRRPAEVEEPSSRFVDVEGDEPDPLIDGRIDLGAIVAEFLALALDPYPRKPGASFAAPQEEPEAEAEPRRSPFAGLGDALRKGRGN
jgi:hypothetical protein